MRSSTYCLMTGRTLAMRDLLPGRARESKTPRRHLTQPEDVAAEIKPLFKARQPMDMDDLMRASRGMAYQQTELRRGIEVLVKEGELETVKVGSRVGWCRA